MISFDLTKEASLGSGVTLTFEKMADPAEGGTLIINANGTGTYDPPPGFTGTTTGAKWRVVDDLQQVSDNVDLTFHVFERSAVPAVIEKKQIVDVKIDWCVLDGDLVLDVPDIVGGDGLRTLVIMSLFSDARAGPDDEIPDGTNDRRGWPGDQYFDEPNKPKWSRLWLLSRSASTQETLTLAREYVEESLQFMVDDRICQSIEVTTEFLSKSIMAIGLKIQRPSGDDVEYRFNVMWDNELNAIQ